MTLLANQHFTMNIEKHDQGLGISLTPMGILRRQDLGLIAPAINRALNDHAYHHIKAFVDIRMLDGVSLRGLLEEIKSISRPHNIPMEMVIIGRKKWHKFIARLIRLATKSKVKYFDCFEAALSSWADAEDTEEALP